MNARVAHQTSDSRQHAVLNRRAGAFLFVLGVVVLAVLFRSTEGHRARITAEALGATTGLVITLIAVGVTRPSRLHITRAYIRLSQQARRLLILGMGLLFGFATITAAVQQFAPPLQPLPAIGGIVTLDWVLSLFFIATAGGTLVGLGAFTCIARTQAIPNRAAARITVLERLWLACDRSDVAAMSACFSGSPSGRALFREWSDITGSLGSARVVLIESATVWDQLIAVWHVNNPQNAVNPQHVVLLCRESGRQLEQGEIFIALSTEGQTAVKGPALA
ncbi:MAG: hypothetical protein M1118_05485 [Chloroflexi bacterium]|nr:hypothetical protein [Chloroflexota bacterium]